MKTAVEWLADELTLPEYGDNPQWVQDAIEQAKEMEKEQIINAAMWMPEPFNSIEFIPELAKQYYNENYGKM
jgi:hypothetical protein